MPTIIQKLPFYSTPQSVEVQGRRIAVVSDQIIVWVSIARMGTPGLPDNALRFPTVLDPGFNHSFLIQQDHLLRWAGFDPTHFRTTGSLPVRGRNVPLLNSNIWLHRNQPGQRDVFSDQPPHCVELDRGIAVCPPEMGDYPRLPLLGLRAIRFGNLHIAIDGQNRHVTIRTGRKFWPFW